MGDILDPSKTMQTYFCRSGTGVWQDRPLQPKSSLEKQLSEKTDRSHILKTLSPIFVCSSPYLLLLQKRI
jgi:hypothetical protein